MTGIDGTESGWRLPFPNLFFLCGLLICLAILSAWTYGALRDNLARQIAVELQRTLAANIAALEIWIEDEKEDVQIAAGDPEVRRLATELHELHTLAGRSAYLRLEKAPQQKKLRDVMRPAVDDPDYRGFVVIGTTGVILASDTLAGRIGDTVSAKLLVELQKLLSGNTLFLHPMEMNSIVDLRVKRRTPVILVAAPVRDKSGKVVAALAFTTKPERSFSRILSAAHLYSSSDSYAVDSAGFILSEPRHENQLGHLGLLPPGATGSVLTVQVRDPGGDLTRGFRPQVPFEKRPLTRMAASIAEGRSGADTNPYRDYRGVKVIGAWRWLPQYGLGIATEWEYAYVMRALKPVHYLFWGIVAAVALLSVTATAAFWWIRRLRRRIGSLARLGQYTLLEKIDEGGIGEVYRARHSLLRRPAAIKLIPPDAADPLTLARFEQEVQITSQLTHPNTISVFDYGHTPEGIFYYAMEYLPGVTLQKLVEIEGALPAERVIHILSQVCASLHEAHDRGLVHRDINPRNIILCVRGGIYDYVKVFDFGQVKDVHAQAQESETLPLVYGAPGFVAPERLTDPGTVKISSDLYSVGAVGYFLLTSETVLGRDFSFDLYTQILRVSPRRPSRHAPRRIPPELDDLIFDCLQRDPAARPASAEELRKRFLDVPVQKWSDLDARIWWQKNGKQFGGFEDGTGIPGKTVIVKKENVWDN